MKIIIFIFYRMLTFSSAPTLVWYLVISVAFPWIRDSNWCREIQQFGLQPCQDQQISEIFLLPGQSHRMVWAGGCEEESQDWRWPGVVWEERQSWSNCECCWSSPLSLSLAWQGSGVPGAAWDGALGLQPTISKAGYCYSDSRASRTYVAATARIFQLFFKISSLNTAM